MDIQGRCCELAWQVYGGDYAQLQRLVEVQGGSWEESEGGASQIAHTWDGRTVGFFHGMDPIAAYVQVCFVLFGVLWPHLDFAQRGMKLLHKEWRGKVKIAKDERVGGDHRA